MNRVFLKFERKAEIIEVGGVGVLVADGETWEDAIEKANAGDFVEFLVTDREYVNDEWSFGPFDPEEDDEEDDDDELEIA